jgi:hypothetical protein
MNKATKGIKGINSHHQAVETKYIRAAIPIPKAARVKESILRIVLYFSITNVGKYFEKAIYFIEIVLNPEKVDDEVRQTSF